MLSEKEIQSLWGYVNQGIEFPWPRSPRTQSNLSSSLAVLLDDSDLKNWLNGLNKQDFNIELRNLISPKLKNRNTLQCVEIANWIVRNWGGIKNGNEAIAGWVERLGDFSEESVAKFVEEMETRRVSSWSKILAFSDPVNHAIYDARTAVALNTGLKDLGVEWRFFMPLSQNRLMKAVRPFLTPSHSSDERGYSTYIDLLKTMAKHNVAKNSILSIEMTLFANAPLLAEGLMIKSS